MVEAQEKILLLPFYRKLLNSIVTPIYYNNISMLIHRYICGALKFPRTRTPCAKRGNKVPFPVKYLNTMIIKISHVNSPFCIYAYTCCDIKPTIQIPFISPPRSPSPLTYKRPLRTKHLNTVIICICNINIALQANIDICWIVQFAVNHLSRFSYLKEERSLGRKFLNPMIIEVNNINAPAFINRYA